MLAAWAGVCAVIVIEGGDQSLLPYILPSPTCTDDRNKNVKPSEAHTSHAHTVHKSGCDISAPYAR